MLWSSKKAWNVYISGSRAFKFSWKVKNTKAAPKVWNKTHFRICEERINELIKEIGDIHQRVPTPNNILLEKQLQSQLKEYLK